VTTSRRSSAATAGGATATITASDLVESESARAIRHLEESLDNAGNAAVDVPYAASTHMSDGFSDIASSMYNHAPSIPDEAPGGPSAVHELPEIPEAPNALDLDDMTELPPMHGPVPTTNRPEINHADLARTGIGFGTHTPSCVAEAASTTAQSERGSEDATAPPMQLRGLRGVAKSVVHSGIRPISSPPELPEPSIDPSRVSPSNASSIMGSLARSLSPRGRPRPQPGRRSARGRSNGGRGNDTDTDGDDDEAGPGPGSQAYRARLLQRALELDADVAAEAAASGGIPDDVARALHRFHGRATGSPDPKASAACHGTETPLPGNIGVSLLTLN
jgi:hypothetical protein